MNLSGLEKFDPVEIRKMFRENDKTNNIFSMNKLKVILGFSGILLILGFTFISELKIIAIPMFIISLSTLIERYGELKGYIEGYIDGIPVGIRRTMQINEDKYSEIIKEEMISKHQI